MALILPGIFSLAQHLTILRTDPESYRPDRCPCGHTRAWCHGCYTKKPDRKDLGEPSLNPVPAPRFYCPECGCTCSRLPECIPPRSWYLWEVREVIVLLLLARNTLGRTSASNGSPVSRKTIKRWWRRLHDRHETFSFNLLPHLPCMGRHAEFTDFWQALLALRPCRRRRPCCMEKESPPHDPLIPAVPGTRLKAPLLAPHRVYPLIGHLCSRFTHTPCSDSRCWGLWASRDRLEKGDLKALVRELAARSYAIPDPRRSFLAEKTIEKWYYAWKRGGIDALAPKHRSDRGNSKMTKALLNAVCAV